MKESTYGKVKRIFATVLLQMMRSDAYSFKQLSSLFVFIGHRQPTWGVDCLLCLNTLLAFRRCRV